MRTSAQTPAADQGASAPSLPAGNVAKPAAGQPSAATPTEANPFPEDTRSVPVLSAKPAPANPGPDLADGTHGRAEDGNGVAGIPLPAADSDPARSPDDLAAASGAQDASSSSSLAGLDSLLPKPDDDQPDKKRKSAATEPEHRESAAEDVSVGGYYLDRKNWKAALSRFQSAMVLDPANPEVYWGLAEAERHLNDFVGARTHYQTVVDYDPDSKHGKEARKALKEPEIANAKANAPGMGTAK